MLEVIKQMNNKGIFKLLPGNDLSNTIKNIDCIDDQILEKIQLYLNTLVQACLYKHNIDMSNNISEFYDKFFDEMFDIKFTYEKHTNGVYQKSIKYGQAGIFTFGIRSLNSTFSFEERKLMKLINHYYISLSSKQGYDDSYFFIPFSYLKLIFPKINNVRLKSKIIEACNSLNDKVIYWDFSKTRYKHDLDKDNLCSGNGEKIVELSVINYPRKTVNGVMFEMKGIICKISKFMRVRKDLNQISNMFSQDNFKSNYLDFMVAEKLSYRVHMCKGNSKKVFKCTQTLRNLFNSIYVYENGIQTNKTYLYHVINDANSKRNLVMLFEAIIVYLSYMNETMNFVSCLKIHNRTIELSNYINNVNEANTRKLAACLYDSIVGSKSVKKKALVRDLIVAGDITLNLDFKCTNKL